MDDQEREIRRDNARQWPVRKTFEEITEAEAEELLAPYWLDPTVNYPEPHYLLEYEGTGFSPLGGIQAISGQKKNGKTFVLVQLMAAILGAHSERVEALLHGLRVNENTLMWLGKEPTVLYVDTEMEQLNSAKVLRRVHWLCGWPQDEPNERFRVLWLRQVEGDDEERAYEKRYRLIRRAIEWMKPTAVFIDGIRDIIGDFNDNTAASQLVTELMSVATRHSCCIWNVLHANPRMQNDDENKMRGHLGTELGNKVSDTFVSVKKKDPGTGRVTFTVKQQDARGKDVDDWTFEVTDDAGSGLGVPRIVGSAKAQGGADSGRQAELKAVVDSLHIPVNGMRYGEIQAALKEQGRGNRYIQSFLNDALQGGLLSHDNYQKRYYKNNPKSDDNDMPF